MHQILNPWRYVPSRAELFWELAQFGSLTLRGLSIDILSQPTIDRPVLVAMGTVLLGITSWRNFAAVVVVRHCGSLCLLDGRVRR